MNFEEMKKILGEMEALIREKNKMYGDENVVKMGKEGILFRIEEKLERIRHLLKTDQNPEKESIEDSWKDIANFGLIGLMLERGKWK